MNNYYVYVYLNPLKRGTFVYNQLNFKYEPFYIGKGKKLRLYEHMKLKDHNYLKNNIIKKILKENKIPIILKIYDNLNNVDAMNIEISMIKHFGRINLNTGCLANLTNGGEGFDGYIQTNEEKIKRINSIKASTFYTTVRSDKFRNHMSNILKERYKDPLKRKEQSNAMMGSKNPMYGKHTSDFQKQTVRQAHINGKIILTKSGRQRIIESNRKRKGKTFSIIRIDAIKYKLISPKSEFFIIFGAKRLQEFCKNKKIQFQLLRKIFGKTIQKSDIKGNTISGKNTIGWNISYAI